jgi:hypothetical protein
VKAGKEAKAKYEGWDLDKYRKEDPKELARIKSEEPEKFAELCNQSFNQ